MKSESDGARERRFALGGNKPYLKGMTDRPKRPADANQLAKLIADIATGAVEDESKPAAQVKGGKIGGHRRAAALTPEQRSEIARAAAQARWKKGD